jgi:hypothetical protein
MAPSLVLRSSGGSDREPADVVAASHSGGRRNPTRRFGDCRNERSRTKVAPLSHSGRRPGGGTAPHVWGSRRRVTGYRAVTGSRSAKPAMTGSLSVPPEPEAPFMSTRSGEPRRCRVRVPPGESGAAGPDAIPRTWSARPRCDRLDAPVGRKVVARPVHHRSGGGTPAVRTVRRRAGSGRLRDHLRRPHQLWHLMAVSWSGRPGGRRT